MLKGGFLRRSLNALRSGSETFKFDPEHYSQVLPMVSFSTPESINWCALGSDADTGGYSTTSLTHVIEQGVPCTRFKGTLSLHVSSEAKKRGMTHSGWAGFRTTPQPANLFNRRPMWDTSLFRFLSLRVKGDDRRYYINVQTDSLDPLELWQHRLFLQTPGEWETVLIPWGDFLRTRNGKITYKKFDGMDRERVKTVGASLIERKEGPYCLNVAEIKSVNTHGNHGPLTRYTKAEAQKFYEEELKRSSEEAAAYYAWKRGDVPLGTRTPEYIPPAPDTEFVSSSTSTSPEDNETAYLFDELTGYREPERDRVDIDTIDVDDPSPEGRKRKMQAMADELEGFSAAIRKDAERAEEERARANVKEGRRVMDHFGQRFEPPPGRR